MRFDNVLVTGGSGLLGRFVVDELAPYCEVGVLDIKPPAQAVPYHEVDILDLGAVARAVAGHDAVVHLAGIDDGNPFTDQEYFNTNVQGAWHVLHAAEAAGVETVVVASSSAAYGLGAERMPDYLPVDEGHPQRPRATYSLTKQVIETVCRSFVERGRLRVVCLRPTLIVRPEREAAILAQLDLPDPESEPPAGARGAGGVAPYGALSVLRTYVRSRDCARCFRLALDHDEARYAVFVVAAADGIGREATLPRLERAYGRRPEVRDPRRYADDPYASVLANTRARERLGWTPAGDWRDVVSAHRPVS